MAIHNGLHSTRVRKSIGLLTYAAWRGIPTVRSKATEVRNPRTTAQIIQRARMRVLAKLGSSAKPAADIEVNAAASGDQLHFYLFFRNPLTGEASPTAYLGSAVKA